MVAPSGAGAPAPGSAGVDHTGSPTWRQRPLAAVLACEPAALWGLSALHAHEGTDGGDAPVVVGVARDRHLRSPEGVRVVRRARFVDRVLWTSTPPRQRYDDAVIDLALGARNKAAVIETLAGSVRRRRTTAARLRANLVARPRVTQDRPWLCAVLSDIDTGSHSVLEHEFLDGVERPHGLPSSSRQQAGQTSAGRIYRDAAYDGLVVELDGHATHRTVGQREADFERDLDTAIEGRDTQRVSYGQVFDRACTTAAKLAVLLAARGWRGRPTPCGPSCPAPSTFDRLRAG